jgi:predicted transcriptional regulator
VLQHQPIATSTVLVKLAGLTSATVNKSLANLEALGIVAELTQRQRGRVFSYRRYVELLNVELAPGASVKRSERFPNERLRLPLI